MADHAGYELQHKEEATAYQHEAAKHGTEHSGEHKGHTPTKGERKKAFLDLSKHLTVSTVASALRVLANEPGEAGELRFKIDALGKIPVGGAVSARLRGWAELTMGYSMNDQNFCVLGVDAEGALAAGIDVAGLVHADVDVGFGRDFLNAWYKTPEEAAEWILYQLSKLNEAAGGRLLHIEGPHEAPEPEFEVEDRKVFAGVEGGVNAGIVEAEAGARITKLHRTYIKPGEHGKTVEIPSTELHKEWSGKLTVDVKGVSISVGFHRDWSNTIGSPFYYANGVFDEYTVTIGVSKEDLFKIEKGPKVEHIPRKAVQDVVLNVFVALEKFFGKRDLARHLTQKMFDKVVEEMYKESRRFEGAATLSYNLVLDWNLYGEADGTENLMYFRVSVEANRGVKGELNAGVGGVEAELEASKSEVVYEKLGTETISYIQRQFVYETKERPWEEFKKEHWDELKVLVKNCATPGFRYYYPEVDKAFHSGKGNNYEAGIKALEQVWLKEKRQLDRIAPDAARIGEYLEKGTGILTLIAPHRKVEYMSKILNVLIPYVKHPKMLKFLLDQLPNYAVETEKLWKLAKDTGYDTLLKWIYKIAEEKGGK